MLASMEKINVEIKEIEQYPIGSVQTALSDFRQRIILLERRRKLAIQMDMVDETFPPKDRLLKAPNNVTFLKDGVIAVKRFKGTREQYHWVGTFAFKKMLEKDSESTR